MRCDTSAPSRSSQGRLLALMRKKETVAIKHRPGSVEALPNSLMEWEGLAKTHFAEQDRYRD